jgi:hypothetical protein
MLLPVSLPIKVFQLTAYLDILLLSLKVNLLEFVDPVPLIVFNAMLQALETVINAKSAMSF